MKCKATFELITLSPLVEKNLNHRNMYLNTLDCSFYIPRYNSNIFSGLFVLCNIHVYAHINIIYSTNFQKYCSLCALGMCIMSHAYIERYINTYICTYVWTILMYLAIGSSAAQSLISLFHIWAKRMSWRKGKYCFHKPYMGIICTWGTLPLYIMYFYVSQRIFVIVGNNIA